MAAKSDILFRPRAKVMREREREREEEGETESGGSGGRKLVCFAATIYVSASAKGGEEKEGRKEARILAFIISMWRAASCLFPSVAPFSRKQSAIFIVKPGFGKQNIDTCVCG